jgi:heme exporter protein D
MTLLNMGGYGGYISAAFGSVLCGMVYLLVREVCKAKHIKQVLLNKEQT